MASWYHKHMSVTVKKGCGVICFAFTQTDAGHGSIQTNYYLSHIPRHRFSAHFQVPVTTAVNCTLSIKGTGVLLCYRAGRSTHDRHVATT